MTKFSIRVAVMVAVFSPLALGGQATAQSSAGHKSYGIPEHKLLFEIPTTWVVKFAGNYSSALMEAKRGRISMSLYHRKTNLTAKHYVDRQLRMGAFSADKLISRKAFSKPQGEWFHVQRGRGSTVTIMEFMGVLDGHGYKLSFSSKGFGFTKELKAECLQIAKGFRTSLPTPSAVKKSFGLFVESETKPSVYKHKCLVVEDFVADSSFKNGCPARRAGLKKGDLIQSINGRHFTGYYNALRLFKEASSQGYTVHLKVFRASMGKQSMDIELRAEPVLGAKSAGQKSKPAAPSWGRVYQVPGHKLRLCFPKSWSVTFPVNEKKSKTLVLHARSENSEKAKAVFVDFGWSTSKTVSQQISEWENKFKAQMKKQGFVYKRVSTERLSKTEGDWFRLHYRMGSAPNFVNCLVVFGVVEGRLYILDFRVPVTVTLDCRRVLEFSKIIQHFDYAESVQTNFSEFMVAFRDGNRPLTRSEQKKLWSYGDKAKSFLFKNLKDRNENVRVWSVWALSQWAGERSQGDFQRQVIQSLESLSNRDPSERVRNRAHWELYDLLNRRGELTPGRKQVSRRHFLSVLKTSKDVKQLRFALLFMDWVLKDRSEEFRDHVQFVLSTQTDNKLRGNARRVLNSLNKALAAKPKPKVTGLVCEKCQKSLRAGAKFCDGCGHKVGPAVCGKCQHKLRKGAKFCDNCGAKQK